MGKEFQIVKSRGPELMQEIADELLNDSKKAAELGDYKPMAIAYAAQLRLALLTASELEQLSLEQSLQFIAIAKRAVGELNSLKGKK